MKKVIVKYQCKCANCERDLFVDEVAWFNIETRKMMCIPCHNAEPNVNTNQPPVKDAEKRPEPSRNDIIAKAHEENMQANQQLVLQLATLNKALIDLMNELKNLTFAIRKGGNA